MEPTVVHTPAELGVRLIEFLRELESRLGRRAAVLVPREALAHALRRRVLEETDGAALLAGVAFLKPDAFAAEICARAGRPLGAGIESAWPAVLAQLIEDGALDGELRTLDADHLRAHEAYPRAIQSCLLELDAAGLGAEQLFSLKGELPGASRDRLHDLAVFRHALDARLGGQTRTRADLRREAVRCLRASPALARAFGPVCIVSLERHERSLWPLQQALGPVPVLRLDPGEGDEPAPRLDRLDFELSLHGGCQDEIDAAACWVERQVLERGVPLGELALVGTDRQLMACLAQELEVLVGEQGLIAEQPALATSEGALVELGLDAVLAGLPREMLLDFLAGVDPDFSPGTALRALDSAAMLGGRAGACSAWRQRLGALQPDLLQRIAPLLDLAELVERDAPLPQTIQAFLGLLDLFPDRSADARYGQADEAHGPIELIRQESEALLRVLRPASSLLRGRSGLRTLADAVGQMRVRSGRYGQARIWLDTPERTAGLPFEALRFVGLCEGSIPPSPSEDPLLSDIDRGRLLAVLPELQRPQLVLKADLARESKRAAIACALATRRSLSASAARQQIGGEQREPSTFLLELAAWTGQRFGEGSPLPSLSELRRHFATPAKRRLADWKQRHPHGFARKASCLGQRGDAVCVPAGWLQDGALQATAALMRAAADEASSSQADGLAGEAPDRPGLPDGASLSVRELTLLLACPLRFAREVLLGLQPPAAFGSAWELDARIRGSLLHRVVQRIFNAFGQQVLDRSDAIADRASAILDEELERQLGRYPLDGPAIEAAERKRLRQLVSNVIDTYRHAGLSRFCRAEQPIGPLLLATPAGALHLSGRIDLVFERPGGALAVHDLKTGRARLLDARKAAEDELDLADLQVLVYEAALRQQLEQDGDPLLGASSVGEAGLVFASAGRALRQRVLAGSALDAGRSWAQRCLALARELLQRGAFVATPNPDDCSYCPFSSVCGDRAPEASQAKLEAQQGRADPPVPPDLLALRAGAARRRDG
ncbi:MAG: PD-(D/E)XK nuclease family protein [Deltaproteobacteria bacterium]|nr:PD-(D/E)XK nuclease family protein [Deltaproteobacteria bacterium]